MIDFENILRRYNICVFGIFEGIENENNFEIIIKEIIEKIFLELNINFNLYIERIYRFLFKYIF